MLIKNSHLLIDACCLLNLCASGELLNILQVISISVQAAIVSPRHPITPSPHHPITPSPAL
jgi:hypothetical protein